MYLCAHHSWAVNCNKVRLVLPYFAVTALFLQCGGKKLQKHGLLKVIVTIYKATSISALTSALHLQARQWNAASGAEDEATSSASSFSVTTDILFLSSTEIT